MQPKGTRLVFRSAGSQSGFTLLEILASLAVLALGLVVLLQTDSLNTVRTIHSSRLMEATFLAQEKMEEIFSRGVPSFAEDEQGEDEGVFSWSNTVSTTEFPGLMEVQVTVNWMEGGRKESFNVVAYLPE